ncbi:hypothetical protein [Corynebacterium testudinoris]|uniref:Uncharacterized protein n=1 Tax=Corynebacterium testudinoris TaxID=136857 RepID=A0A0G3HDJ7_9CORY|nr:hypothetical protein [Corynebacterium testudinoris]AKK09197.1 hypothetical protein CTEST_08835 [Corynebacterium testudinoris]
MSAGMHEQRSALITRVVGGLAMLALVAALIFAFFDDATSRPLAPNGDTVGKESAEPYSVYAARAADTLAAADDPAYALVTFTHPLTPEETQAALGSVGRVNAMVIDSAPPFPLPEPVDGASRSSVFHTQLDRIALMLSGVGEVPVPERIDAVVVYDAGDSLREVASHTDIATVEVLPADASWGRFGVRPVEVPQG